MGHAACMDKNSNNTKVWSDNLKERYTLEDPNLYERATLSWILKK